MPAFTVGEVAPALFGRFDSARMHVAAATMRNLWPSFRGGAYSRAGTAFVGFSKQTGRSYPPRMIPFQFSINQGLALEFGNYYMRVVSDGAFVTESPFAITGASQTSPCVLTYASLSTAVSATANLGAVTGSYARGDTITLAGGTFTTPAALRVLSTTLARLTLNAAGTGYVVGDRLTLANTGGVYGQAPILTVLTIGGSGAIATFAISNGGVFSANGGTAFTQSSTTGAGSGATFQTAIWGPLSLSVFAAGSYSVLPSNPLNQSSTSGTGVGATYKMVWATPAALANGDWLFVASIVGMTQLNNQTFIIGNLTATTFQLYDVYNNAIDATAFTAYISGGTAARIYTLATIYSEQDLDYLKFTQSADVMSICCVNQATNTEYPPLDLARTSDANWSFSQVVPAASVTAPTGAAVATSSAGAVGYSYVVTAVSPTDGAESVASNIATVTGAVNISATAGTNTVTWNAVPGVNEYNVYKATPGISTSPPTGSLFGFAGHAYGTQFLDSNIIADFSTVPPKHLNPFAPGQITGVRVTGGGAGATFTVTINSLTGSGAVLTPIVVANVLVGFVIDNPGQNYLPTDTLTINNGATATLVVGATSGTYPAAPGYFQQRRAYGYTLNDPDTYFMSQPGAYTNLDRRNPTLDTDAIVGTPWAVEVNGIQFMLDMPGGLVVFTGASVWQLTGAGGSSLNPQPLTPSSQQATPQAANGCSSTVPPVQIEGDILYVTSKGSFYYDIEYSISSNIYAGNDITINSTHLFTGYRILQHAWCQQPYRLLWGIRDDGVLLSLTWLRPEKVSGWARHDTQGTFETVCSITEPPVDALYLGTQRTFGSNVAYVIERMDNRIWAQTEDCWCVDCGFSLNQPEPAATLTASSATGLGAITGATGIIGGAGYSVGTTGTVVDDNGAGDGSGAVPTLTFAGGALTNVTFAGGQQGTSYAFPQLVLSDPAGSAGGSGASATLTLNNSATFRTDADVFSLGSVGSVIRMGGGMAVITAYVSARQVTGNILSPIVRTVTDAAGNVTPQPASSGQWSLTAPVATVTVPQLAGATVTGLADGNVIAAQVVPSSGLVTLPAASSAVIVGLGFQAQLQSVYLDAGEPTAQGQRKKIAAVTARLEASSGVTMTTNQVDGSTLSPPQTSVTWNSLDAVENKAVKPYNAPCQPLYTGDTRITAQGGFSTRGQVALQQSYPLPMNVLALIPEDWAGDLPEQKKSQRERGQRQAA